MTRTQRTPLAERPGNLQITDHALVRYFERVAGVDLDEIRRRLTGAEDWTAIKSLPDGIYPVNGHRIRVKENTVVTVLPGSGG